MAEQRGVDVLLTLTGPDGTRVIEVNNAAGGSGAEHIVLVDGPAGDYLLEVRTPEKAAAEGRYEVWIRTLREATARDKDSVAASGAFMQAESARARRTAEALREAVGSYDQALKLYRAAGDRSGEALTLNNLGAMYDALGERDKAMDHFTQSLILYRLGDNREGEAMALGNICKVHDDRGEKRRALECYLNVRALYQGLRDRGSEAAVLSRVAATHAALGQKRQALAHHALALDAYREARDADGEAAALNNLGTVSQDLGDSEKALEYFEQSLSLYGRAGERGREGAVLGNIGFVYDALGEKQQALDYYLRALPLKREAGDRSGAASTLNNIGTAYDSIGEKEKALWYLAQSLSLYGDLKDDEGAALAITNIGKVYDDLGQSEKALGFYLKALDLYRRSEAREGEATTLGNIGATYADLGDKPKAMEYYSKALALYRDIEDRGGEAVTLNNLGVLYESSGESEKALEHYLRALPLYGAVGDEAGRATTLANVALIERDRGNFDAARTRIEEALSVVESLRGKLDVQEWRSSYFATTQGYYAFYVDLLMRLHKRRPGAGHEGEALHASERARARGLLDLLAEARVDIRQGVPAGLIERERLLQHRLNAKAHERALLLSGSHTAEEATALAQEIFETSTERQQVEAQIKRASGHNVALSRPAPLTLRDIQTRVLDADTLLLEYSLGRDRSYLWAVTPDSVNSYELPGREEIESAARLFHSLLSRPAAPSASGGDDPELAEAASRLSRMVLGPAASQLGRKRLLLVADGALQYVPFAALPDPAAAGGGPRGGRPLILGHEVVGLPSASILAALRSELARPTPAPQTLAVLADPVFSTDDARVKGAPVQGGGGPPAAANSANFERLPGSREEALRISGFVPPGGAMLALGFDASRALAVSGKLAGYRYVHFATHGRLDDARPELSAVILTLVDERGNAQNGYLRLNEIFNLKLSAEVVVLSGCETGRGKQIRGEGLVGLTRGFMSAGAARVVASLWRVDDAATAELMASFYKGMLAGGRRPAEALRAAQIEMLKDTRRRSPRNWAAFVLQGDWR